MKSYTDLEQSRVLKKILPLESADMHYRDWKRMTKDIRIAHVGSGEIGDLPCWSLVALFSMLPKSAYLEKGSSTELYRLTLPVELISSDWNLEPIDACVAVIEDLHEQKLL